MRIWIRSTALVLANLRFCYLRTGTQRKFADLRFSDLSLQICGFAICILANLRSLRIYYCGMSPRICRFAICGQKKICVPTFVSSCMYNLGCFNLLDTPIPNPNPLPIGCMQLNSPFLVQKSNQNTWFSATLDFSLVFRWFSSSPPTIFTNRF